MEKWARISSNRDLVALQDASGILSTDLHLSSFTTASFGTTGEHLLLQQEVTFEVDHKTTGHAEAGKIDRLSFDLI